MTEETAWVIEEYPTGDNVEYKGRKEWSRYPSIDDQKCVDDMEPTTLQKCLEYLRDDPFSEYTPESGRMWITRLYNLVTHEQIMYDDICHK